MVRAGVDMEGGGGGEGGAPVVRAGVGPERAVFLGSAASVVGAGGGRYAAAARRDRPGHKGTRQRRAGIVLHDYRQRFGQRATGRRDLIVAGVQRDRTGLRTSATTITTTCTQRDNGKRCQTRETHREPPEARVSGDDIRLNYSDETVGAQHAAPLREGTLPV